MKPAPAVRFYLTLRCLPGDRFQRDPGYRLRGLLKRALRDFGMDCEAASMTEPTLPPGAYPVNLADGTATLACHATNGGGADSGHVPATMGRGGRPVGSETGHNNFPRP